MERQALFLLLILLVLSGGSAAVLTAESWPQRGQEERGQEFQQLVGGLGLGPAVDLGDCCCCFDPRLDSACGFDRGPIPGGSCFCPRHACSVFFYPPLANGPRIGTGD